MAHLTASLGSRLVTTGWRVQRLLEGQSSAPVGSEFQELFSSLHRAGHLQTAHSFLLNANDYSLPELCMERAQWMKNQVSCPLVLQLTAVLLHAHTHTHTHTHTHRETHTMHCYRCKSLLRKFVHVQTITCSLTTNLGSPSLQRPVAGSEC